MLAPGTRLGVYTVAAPLGAGGMGEVYRARDTKLERDVAIKILPSSFALDTDRLARFEREARALASLNHPNIAAIYGIEESLGVTALVLELVDGETLAARIMSKRSGLALSETLALARQIADALDAAHERGIVHRDLKPANMVLTPDGTVKVLDFGLAKTGGLCGDDGLTHSPTMLGPTVQGILLGTAPYMSPEQARGKVVDKRTDIWAFGCVVYEMLTGRRAFAGETTTDVLAAILEREPDWSALRAATPPNITRLLQRCLEKDPKRRLRDIGDARVDFDGGAAVSTDSRARRGRLVPLWTVALPSLAAVAIVAAVMRAQQSRSSAPAWAADAATLSIEIPPATTLDPSAPALSPDGGQMAWVASGPDGRTRIWTAMLGTGVPRDLGGTDGGSNPFWSSDGRSIAFLVQGALKRIELSTGAIRSIASVPVVSSGGTWNGDDVIVFAARYSLLAVPAAGGSPKIVATLNREMQENQLLYPQFLPDGRHFLYAARSGRPDKSGVYVGSLDGTRVRLFSTTSFVRYVDPGYLLYVREGALVARSFASRTLTVGAETTTLVDRVVVQGASMNGGFDVSSQGVLAFFQRQILPDQLLRWFDRAGKPIGDLTEAGSYYNFRISRDGRRVAADRADASTGARSVWVYELDGRPASRVTFAGIDEWRPVWSPDGQRVAFMSYRDGPGDIYVKSLSMSAPEAPLLISPDQKVPIDWSADGRFLAYASDRADTRQDVWVTALGTKDAPIPIAKTPFDERQPTFSPDGRFIAYESDETGEPEIYVQPFPPNGAKWQVSVRGGTNPVWRGAEILFDDRDRMLVAVPVTTTGTSFSSGRGLPLFKVPTRGGAGTTAFDVSADGRRVLVRVPLAPTPQPLMVMLNWQAKLRKRFLLPPAFMIHNVVSPVVDFVRDPGS